MNSNNFADWEITKMLPEKEYDRYNPYLIDDDNEIVNANHWDIQEYRKPVYTWEDVRLYLESKGYEVCIDVLSNMPNKPKWYDTHIYHNNKELYDYNEVFTTYEETRKSAIIYCLNLINNEKGMDS